MNGAFKAVQLNVSICFDHGLLPGIAVKIQRLTGLQVDADKPEGEAKEQAGQTAGQRIAEHRRHRRQRQHHQGEVLGWSEQQRHLDH